MTFWLTGIAGRASAGFKQLLCTFAQPESMVFGGFLCTPNAVIDLYYWPFRSFVSTGVFDFPADADPEFLYILCWASLWGYIILNLQEALCLSVRFQIWTQVPSARQHWS